MKRSVIRKPRRRAVPKKKILKIKKEPFKDKIKELLEDIIAPKYVSEVLKLHFKTGDLIFVQKNADVIYQLLFMLKKDVIGTISMLKHGWMDQNDLYFNLNVLNKVKQQRIAKENEYFDIADALDSGIQCKNPHCLSYNIRILDRGPTTGDEASRSLYQCMEPKCRSIIRA